MGLGAKLNLAFITVIIVMVGSQAIFELFQEWQDARTRAQDVTALSKKYIIEDINQIQDQDRAMASQLKLDNRFQSAWAAHDRQAVASVVKSYIDKTGFPGFITIIDSRGVVFYSSDSPDTSNYFVVDRNPQITRVVSEFKAYNGAAALTTTGALSISNMDPIGSAMNVSGIVAVNEPVDNELLLGLQEKLKLTDCKKFSDIGLVVYNTEKHDVQAAAIEPRSAGSSMAALKAAGEKALTGPPWEFESNGRWWRVIPLKAAEKSIPGYVLVSMPTLDLVAKAKEILKWCWIAAIPALVLGFLYATGFAGEFYNSMKFLMQRAQDLAAQRQQMPPLEGLNKDWMELAEVIDTAVSAPRSSVKSLQTQMNKHTGEIQEKGKLIEAAQAQVEAVNKQLMVQGRQLAEAQKQVTHANSQSILLQQKLAAVLQISGEGFLILDQFGNVLSANHIFLGWVGSNEGEIAGRYCFDFIKKPGQPRDTGTPQIAFSTHGSNPNALIENFFPEGVIYQRNSDKAIQVVALLHPISADQQQVQGYVMVLRDKTMHAEVNRLRAEIVAMLQESIRAPLAAAEERWSEVLNSATKLGMQLGAVVVELHDRYRQLIGVVDNLLMMHGGIVPTIVPPERREQVQITRVVSECLEATAEMARAHQVILDYKTVQGLPAAGLPKDVLADVIQQMLNKLISITAPGGRVRLESAARNNEIKISISSSGPALPSAEIEDMFVGYVPERHAEDTYSSRLALYLVRNNVERFGGRVWAESDRGTAFYLTLPIV